MYFTLREMGGSWKEERAIRHVEPALAFQLELSSLSNYNLTPILVQNKQLHIYHGVARENQLDNRFFIRGLVRPGRVRGGISMAKYLISETDRLVTSILNSLEVVSTRHRSRFRFKVTCMHSLASFPGTTVLYLFAALWVAAGFLNVSCPCGV